MKMLLKGLTPCDAKSPIVSCVNLLEEQRRDGRGHIANRTLALVSAPTQHSNPLKNNNFRPAFRFAADNL